MHRHNSRFLLSLALIFAACGGDDHENTGDTLGPDGSDLSQAPTVDIVSPESGTVVGSGDVVSVTAQIGDDHDAVRALQVLWRSDLHSTPFVGTEPTAGGRVVVELKDLVVGTHTITLDVTDSDGLVGRDTLTLVVRGGPATPVVAITPAEPTTQDTLVAVLTPPDPGTTTTESGLRYVWLKDGTPTDHRGPTVPATATTRGETWEVRVTAFSGALESAAANASVTVVNAAPTCSAATLLPSAGTRATEFTCACPTLADADTGDTDRSRCTFYSGDVVVGDEGDCTLAAGETERGMALTCTLIPSDGTDDGTAVTSPSVPVLNARPTAPGAGLEPSVGTAADEFTCLRLVNATDIDGDSLTYTTTWLVNGVEDPNVHTTTTAATLLRRDDTGTPPRHGDTIQCRLQASDGTDTSSPGDSPAVTLGNATPTLGKVMVEVVPEGTATANSTLMCVTSDVVDADTDSLSTTYVWFIDGVAVEGATTATLNGGYVRGDRVECEATVSDGQASSETVTSKNTIVVANALPSVADVTTTPESTSGAGGEITCVWTGWVDADGDMPDVIYTWFVDEVPVPEEGGATFDPSGLEPGVEVTCAVTPRNDAALGDMVVSSQATLIINSAPTLTGATVGPSGATVTATLTCTPEGVHDADGDTVSFTFEWTLDGATIEGQSLATLSGVFGKGDSIRCRVTPHDTFESGAPVLSGALTIHNAIPTLVDTRVDPAGGSPCKAYTCVPEGGDDADEGDVISYGYRWLVNGDTVSGQSSATFGGTLGDGDTLACAARPTDGTTVDQALVYGAERVSSAVAIDDTPPVIGSVVLSPEAPGVGSILTCTATGTEDDCAAQVTYTYQWYVNGGVVEGATGSSFDTADNDLADQVRCQVTPHDGLSSGNGASSPTIALGPGAPTAPTVEVVAESGPSGLVMCTITTAARWFVNPSYTYYWSINGATEFTDTAALTAARADCDVITCRVQVTDEVASLSSEVASLQFPLVDGCEDGNGCTSHFCLEAGGCGVLLEDGTFCEDADPCSPTGVCDQGSCVALGNHCVEEPINLDVVVAGRVEVDIAGLPDGRYVSIWANNNKGPTSARMTAADDSRRDEETLLSTGNGTGGLPSVAVSSGGSVLLLDPTPRTATAKLTAHLRSADDINVALLSPVVVVNRPSDFFNCSNSSRWAYDVQGYPMFVGGVPMVVHTQMYHYQPPCGGTISIESTEDLTLVPLAGDYANTPFELVDGAVRGPQGANVVGNLVHHFTAAASIPNTSGIVTAWSKDFKTVVVRVSDFVSGAVSTRFTINVDTGVNNITGLAVEGLGSGGLVVAWARPNGTQGADVFYRRYDRDGVAAGPAVLANSRVAGDQVLDDIAGFSDDGVVVTYTDPGTGQGSDVFARLFDATDTPEGDAIPLALYSTAQNQYGAKVTVFPDDGWVASWVDDAERSANLFHLHVMTRRFFRDGDPDPGVRAKAAPSQVTGDQTNPASAVLPGDRILVAWEAPLFPGFGTEIQRRLFDKDGTPLELDTTVNTTIEGVQKSPAATASTNRYVVAWESVGQDGDGSGIYLQRFDGRGLPLGDETRVNTTTAGPQTGPVLVSRPDGMVLVAWTGREIGGTNTDVFAKIYDADGNMLMAETVINKATTGNQSMPAVTVTKDGHFILAWQSQDEVAGLDVFMRKLSVGTAPNGTHTFTLATVVFRANENTDGDQGAPTVSISQGTTPYLAVCWESLALTTTGRDVLCQIFNDLVGGFAVARAEFSPVSDRTGTQQKARVTHVSTGQLVVAWETPGIDFTGTGIHFTRLPAAGPAQLLPRYVANRYPYGDQTRPVLSPLTTDAGRVLIVWQSQGEDGSGAGVMMRAPFAP